MRRDVQPSEVAIFSPGRCYLTASDGEPTGSQLGSEQKLSADDEQPVTVPPRKSRRMWWLLLVAGVGLTTFFVTREVAYNDGVEDERARVTAEASISAASVPPPSLYCPDADSDEIKTKAIRDKPVVVIAEPPTERVLVMRKAVVVVVEVEITVDIVICGNDSALVLKRPLHSSALVLMQGGTDTQNKAAGPTIFMVDGVAAPQAGRVWFSNRKPQFTPCTIVDTRPDVRPCASYFSLTPPTASTTSSTPARPSSTR